MNKLKLISRMAEHYIPKYYDVGVNITDSMFSGNYRNHQHHKNDIIEVLNKAYNHHVNDILLTGSSLDESLNTIEIIKSLKNFNELNPNKKIPNLFSTVGVHPCTVLEFENSNYSIDDHLLNLENLIITGIKSNIVKAFGEIGLDYDRLHYTPKDKQLFYFKKQLSLATKFDLPLFLHMRSACDDFIDILKPFLDNKLLKNQNLLVHSFTGNKDELVKILNLEVDNYKIFISLNGASLRDQSTLDIIDMIPIDRLMIETDSPWCEIKKTHPSWKFLSKSPNIFYPCHYENYDLLISQNDNEISKLLNENKKNGNNLKLFDFLPIPIVKSDKLDSFKYNDKFIDSPLIKSRNEPCLIGFVAQVISEVTGKDPKLIIESCYNNSKSVFG